MINNTKDIFINTVKSVNKTEKINKVGIRRYYNTYHGHPVDQLERIHTILRKNCNSIIFFAGDSSLDNKYWLLTDDTSIYGAEACNHYEKVLHPPKMERDVNYWVNREIENRGIQNLACINTSVEASTIGERVNCLGQGLWPQDEFIRDNIRKDDTLIVSVGGNDIAMRPSLRTILCMLTIMGCSEKAIRNNRALGFKHFVNLFKKKIEKYLLKLTERCCPKEIIVCMIYYPDEVSDGSWADFALNALGYNKNPKKLQLLIRKAFEVASQKISIPGAKITPFPLFKVLDGKNHGDYIQRVEPSSQGGRKMANAFLDEILKDQ